MSWAFIPGRAPYQASDSGEIRNGRFRRKLRQHKASNGAMFVHVGSTTALVHYLVLTAFTGQPLIQGYYPKHRNGDKSDNSLENLVWAGKPRRMRSRSKKTRAAAL